MSWCHVNCCAPAIYPCHKPLAGCRCKQARCTIAFADPDRGQEVAEWLRPFAPVRVLKRSPTPILAPLSAPAEALVLTCGCWAGGEVCAAGAEPNSWAPHVPQPLRRPQWRSQEGGVHHNCRTKVFNVGGEQPSTLHVQTWQAVLIGSDCPDMGPDVLSAALSALDSFNVRSPIFPPAFIVCINKQKGCISASSHSDT